MKVLFICDHNRGRSQMAAAFYNKYSSDGHADSAGTTVLTPGQTIKQRAMVSEGSKHLLATMDEEDLDIRQQVQKPIDKSMVNKYDKIIVMAEKKSIPDYVKTSSKYEYWQVEDPQSKGAEKTEEVKNIIKEKIQKLVEWCGYIDSVKQAFPELKFDSAKVHENGWDCIVVELDNKWMFRIPRKLRDMSTDAKLVEQLSEYGLSVPSDTHIAKDGSIYGYRKIPGAELRPAEFNKLSTKQQESALQQIADFLTTLHGINLTEIEKLGFAPKPEDYLLDTVKGWVKQHLAHRLAPDELDRIYEFFKDWEGNLGGYQPCLVHGDFSSDHILYQSTREQGVQLGFIDFSDSIIHDPAGDFAKLWDYGEEVFEKILSCYKTKNDKEGIRKRSKIYKERVYVWHLADPFLGLPYLPFDFETARKEFREAMM